MKSNSKKFLFIHIPKTAGNAVQKVLMPYSDDEIYRESHKDGKLNDFEVKNELGICRKHEWVGPYIENPEVLGVSVEDYFKFSVVRNPWERMVSWYCYTFPRISQEIDKDHFFENGLGKNMPSMKDYLYYDGKNQMDYIIRYENLEEGFKEVCLKLDIPFEGFEVTNPSTHPHYSNFYNDDSLSKIDELYGDDAKIFNYSYENSHKET